MKLPLLLLLLNTCSVILKVMRGIQINAPAAQIHALLRNYTI